MATQTSMSESTTHSARASSDRSADRIAATTSHDGARPLSTATAMEPLQVEDSEATAEPEYPTGTKFFLIALSLSFLLIMGGLDLNIVATAVPSITDHFHTIKDVGWYTSSYRLTSCSFQFFFGKLYQMYSTKYILLVSISIFLLGNTLSAAATSSAMFIVGRAISGLGFSGGIAGCFTVLVQILPLRKRPVYTSMLGLVEAVASLAAPTLGGILTERLSWRWCFWISLPIGGISLIAFATCFTDIRKPEGYGRPLRENLMKLDLVGNIVLVPSISCLFLALSWAGLQYPWSDPKIIALLVVFGVLAIVFAIDQHIKQDNATLPPRILKRRSVIAGFLFALCCNSSLTVFEYFMPTYFQIIRGYSPARSGYMMIPMVVGACLGFVICGSGTSIIGFYTPFMLIGAVLTPVAAGLMTTWKVDSSLAELIGYSTFAGFAGAIGFQGPQSAVQSTLLANDVPLGIAIVLFAQNFGPAVFISAAQTIFTTQLAHNLHAIAPHIDAKTIESMGLSELKATVGAAHLEQALVGFDKSLTHTWYLGIALACALSVGAGAMEWKSVKEKKA